MMLRSNPLSVFMRKNAPDTRCPGQNCGETDFLSRIRSLLVPRWGGKGGGRSRAPVVPPSPWLPLMRELSPQATEGENLQPVGAGRFPMGVHHISPSVKPFGFATSLVRGRQDEGRGQRNEPPPATPVPRPLCRAARGGLQPIRTRLRVLFFRSVFFRLQQMQSSALLFSASGRPARQKRRAQRVKQRLLRRIPGPCLQKIIKRLLTILIHARSPEYMFVV